MEHGTITTDPTGSTTANTVVTLTIAPAKGYQLKEGSLTVIGPESQVVTVSGNQFTMPAHNVTVSAEFEAIEYTISYDLDGGINDADNPTNYTVENAITLSEPTKEGFTFQGWTWAGRPEPQLSVNIPAGNTGNLTFTAHWEDKDTPIPPTKYTVTVNNSHASITGAGDYAEGTSVTIQAGSRKGYTFVRWTVTSGNVKLDDDSSTTTTFTMPGEDVTVTANWAEDEEPEPTPTGAITVTPADIIIYMGGKSYEGAVDSSGTIISDQNLSLIHI